MSKEVICTDRGSKTQHLIGGGNVNDVLTRIANGELEFAPVGIVPPGANDFEILGEVYLAGDATAIDFVNIPQTFRHLFLTVDWNQAACHIATIRFNGDAGPNYNSTIVQCFNFVLGGFPDLAQGGINSPGCERAFGRLWVPNYANVIAPAPLLLRQFAYDHASVEGGTPNLRQFWGYWQFPGPVVPLTRIEIAGTGFFKTGSIFTLAGYSRI